MRCPPEMCMERPSVTNRFRWAWAVCQPDAHWAELQSGSHENKLIAIRQCENAYYLEFRRWQEETGYD